ncbi:elongation factor P [Blattabacterium cuenoti]|uniref:elongation factor P n=1 Tax=Blattabacterium cuenoti TaxID=1653831 RepID=UPI00311ED190
MKVIKSLYIQWNKDIFKIIDFLHVKPGKGYAFIRTKLKNLVTGHVLENKFASKHKLKKIKIEFHLQIEKRLINNINIEFLKKGMKIPIFFHVKSEKERIFLFLKMPTTVIFKVVHTESVKKGDTINNNNKIVVLETGTKLLVPSFIKTGEFFENKYKK